MFFKAAVFTSGTWELFFNFSLFILCYLTTKPELKWWQCAMIASLFIIYILLTTLSYFCLILRNLQLNGGTHIVVFLLGVQQIKRLTTTLLKTKHIKGIVGVIVRLSSHIWIQVHLLQVCSIEHVYDYLNLYLCNYVQYIFLQWLNVPTHLQTCISTIL